MQSKWYKEILNPWRLSMVERGIIFTIREMMNNKFVGNRSEVEEAFGELWDNEIHGLVNQQLVDVKFDGTYYYVSVVVKGDYRRNYNTLIHKKSKARKKGLNGEKM